MAITPKRLRRTVFDLTPQELRELARWQLVVSATKPPERPRISAYRSNGMGYEHAMDVYERYRTKHQMAKDQRNDWLKAQGISRKVAGQAILAGYHPYAKAHRIGLVAPPEPPGYTEALKELFAYKGAKPATKI